ncbi:unnamed protein product [Rhizoctonia solani]|uniref:T6SS Phospholipase effector Tle1-like catalytic domain-containing protein n=1 Tax=Rhizoctonia solani TaxID=456999 RepID=A0A8H2ZZ19_9AGAM|nr:unnamed protein product [Rhizoctonia solani]
MDIKFTREPSKYHSGFANSYHKYELGVEQESNFGPIRVTSYLKGGEDVNAIFSLPGDSTFNLSPYIGVDEEGKLFWDINGCQAVDSLKLLSAGRTEGYEHRTRCNVLRIGYRFKTEQLESELNLDEFLDVVEYYDEPSQQFRLRLGVKPKHPKRSLVLCFDGTSNHFTNRNTNVVKLVEILKKNDPSEQMVGPIENGSYNLVMDGYRYLMQTYQAGDEISIFGFSRGAYTARALAEQVKFAYDVYAASEKFVKLTKDEDYLLGAVNLKEGDKRSFRGFVQNARPGDVNPEGFKMVFCTPVEIAFLGVWDTVGSMGALRRKTLPWITYNPSVRNFRQALALDEARANFIPTLWDHAKTRSWQSAVEVWFKGAHSDVGGSAPLAKKQRGVLSILRSIGLLQALEEPAGSQYLDSYVTPQSPGPLRQLPDLSNISLRWMVNQCLSLSSARILFDPYAMHSYRRAKILEDRPHGATPEEIQRNRIELDNYDISSAPYHAIDMRPWWLLLEVLPIPRLSQVTTDRSDSESVLCPNWRIGRVVNKLGKDDHVRLHYSVCKNITAGPGYQPAAQWHSSISLLDIEDSPETQPKTEKMLDDMRQRWKPYWFQQKTLKLSKSYSGFGWIAVHVGAALYYWFAWKWASMVLGGYYRVGNVLIRTGWFRSALKGAAILGKQMSGFFTNRFDVKGL